MCNFRKKLFLCGHMSGPHVELCRPSIITSTVCQPLGEDPVPRNSHFRCFDCIRDDARQEIQDKINAQMQAERDAQELQKAQELAQREKLKRDIEERREKLRREARLQAEKEREEEKKVKEEMEKEKERARLEGGLWLDVTASRKGRGRKNGGGVLSGPSTPTPKSAPAVLSNVTNGGVDPGGRAGVWGPKKILTRDDKDKVNTMWKD